jgi:hypothetical protein
MGFVAYWWFARSGDEHQIYDIEKNESVSKTIASA